MKAKYFQKEILDIVVGAACLVVFDDNSVEAGYLLETENLPLKERVGVHKSSKYCILPLNPRKGKYFFHRECIREIVYVYNRYIMPKTLVEEKQREKEPIKTNCIGEIINHTMPYENFKLLWDEGMRA